MSISRKSSQLLIDFGATHFKVAVSTNGKVTEQTVQRVSTLLKHDGVSRFYQVEDIKRLMDNAVVFRHEKTRLNGIYISTQMSCGYGICDGQEVTPVVSWQDRTSKFDIQSVGKSRLRSMGNDLKIGSPVLAIDSYLPSLNISKPIEIDTLGGLLVRHLDNDSSSLRHVTDGCSLGGYDLFSSPPKSLPEFGNYQLPILSETIEAIGQAPQLGLAQIYTPIGDQQASLLGAGLISGEIGVNIGTGGQVASITSSPSPIGKFQVRPYFAGEYLRTITHLPAGRVVAAYYEHWVGKFGGSFEQFLSLADNPVPEHMNIGLELEVTESEAIRRLALGLLQSPSLLPALLSRSLVGVYSSAIETLGLELNQKLVFAGGLGTKFKAFQKGLGERLGLSFRIHKGQDSSIEGLNKLASSIHG